MPVSKERRRELYALSKGTKIEPGTIHQHSKYRTIIYEDGLPTLLERQSHCNLNTPCIPSSSPNSPRYHLMRYLGRPALPGRQMNACHLCLTDSRHGRCRNPQHMYWGTPSENMADKIWQQELRRFQNFEQQINEIDDVNILQQMFDECDKRISLLQKEMHDIEHLL